jgi:uncharacterized Zn finger protein
MKKSKCNTCGRKVHPKVKKHSVGELDFYYVRCSKCKTVYPAYVEDQWVKDKKAEVETLQKTAWGGDEMSAEEKLKTSQRIIHIQKEVEYVAKTLLVKTHRNVFSKLGDRVY